MWINKPTLSEFVELNVTQRKTLTEIAPIFGVHPDVLSLYVRKVLNGTVISHKMKIPNYECRQMIVDDYSIMKNIKSVCKKYSISRVVANTILAEFGVDIKHTKNIRQSEQLKGRNKRTTDEYREYCDTVGIKVIDEYNGVEGIIKHQCVKCDHNWDASPNNILHRHSKCPKCANKESGQKRSLTADAYRLRLQKACPTVIALEDYVICGIPILHKCLVCDTEYKKLPIGKNDKPINGCRICSVPHGFHGIPTKVNNITLDSKFEAICYTTLLEIFDEKDIVIKQRYDNLKYISDFYIPNLDLWIEVSSYNEDWYLEKIYTKRKLVKNFIFFSDPTQIKEYFKGNKL